MHAPGRKAETGAHGVSRLGKIRRFGPPAQTGDAQPLGFVTVQEGCDKFCTFCVVPYTRGEEVSRAGRDIIAEAQALVAQGVCEITLLGQNVNAWSA